MNTVTTKNPGASVEAIQYHYDISNDFYRLWLGSTNTYSCGIWEENDTLELAQLRKVDFHIDCARASGAKRVLDIGCGWGTILKRLVETHNVERAVGLTLSKAQAESIRSFNHPKIEAKLESWSDHSPDEPYDAIISSGAFEHFVKLELNRAEKIEAYRNFFSCCHQWLKPGGWMSLQTEAYGNVEDGESQFLAEVFPDSNLPRLAEIAEATERLFEIVAIRNDPKDYELTSKAWLSGLKANRDRAISLIGEEAVKRYEKLWSVYAIAYHTGKMELFRITMRRIDKPRK